MIDTSIIDIDILMSLKIARWSCERKVDISNIIEELSKEGYETFPLAIKVLENFHCINIDSIKNKQGKFISGDLKFNLVAAAGEVDMLDIYEPIAQERIFPLGEIFSQFILYIGVSGKIYMGSYDDLYLVGKSIEECFNNLLNRNENKIIQL